MQLTIDIKEAALDKIMYLLENLKSDVKIIDKSPLIEALGKDDDDYRYIILGRKQRKESPESYCTLDDIDWA